MITALFALGMAAESVDPSFMAGYWLRCDDKSEVSETWSDARGGVLLGSGMTFGGGRVSWEQMRIGPSGEGYAFFAMPSGQPAAEFPLVRQGSQELVFENMSHDFPQRVIYRRSGDALIGRVEGSIDGKPQAMEWRYTAAPLNTRCWPQAAAEAAR